MTPVPSRPALGILLMTVAMLAIPTVDGIAKHLSAGYSPLFISWARYLVACLAVLPVAAFLHGGVRKTNDDDPRQSRAGVHLDLDDDALQTDDRAGIDTSKHGVSVDNL